MDNILKEIAKQYSKLNCVYAVVQAGSRTSNQNDESSDYDIYIYTDMEIPTYFREELAKTYTNNYEINNQYFETGDEWILENGIILDFMFRSPDWIQRSIENVFEKHYASNGYTTCFLHNVATSKILYDKSDWFKNLQNKINQPYPEELQKNIIKRNLMLLKDKKCSSYFDQIKLAIKRQDPVSINHRITAFLASYFDILFATNKIYHPGEKRLIKYAQTHCKKLPQQFETDITELLQGQNQNQAEVLERMIERLKQILP